MEKKGKKVTVENPVFIAGITIIPVVTMSLYYQHIDGLISIIGIKQPVGLIVITATSKKAFKITGGEIPIEQLEQLLDVRGHKLSFRPGEG